MGTFPKVPNFARTCHLSNAKIYFLLTGIFPYSEEGILLKEELWDETLMLLIL